MEFANSSEEHDEKMKLIMDRLRKSVFKLNLDKCEFLLTQFAKPLSKLLHKDIEFKWMEKEEQAFSILKEHLCNPPILQYQNYSKPFNITTDAFGCAIGEVLFQGEIGQDLFIAYTSRVLRGPELSYEVQEKEAVAMIHAVKIFRSYIFGKKIKIITDHQPLVWFKTGELNTRVQKWRYKLSEFEYEVIYKSGKLNSNKNEIQEEMNNPSLNKKNDMNRVMIKSEPERRHHRTKFLQNQYHLK